MRSTLLYILIFPVCLQVLSVVLCFVLFVFYLCFCFSHDLKIPLFYFCANRIKEVAQHNTDKRKVEACIAIWHTCRISYYLIMDTATPNTTTTTDNSRTTLASAATAATAAAPEQDPLETAKWTQYLPETFGLRESVRASSYRWCVRESGMWGIGTATAMGLHRWRMGSKVSAVPGVPVCVCVCASVTR